ncbi:MULTISPECIES: maleylpyruvate isomerase family mycothiol-dependent enzyme [Brevibacterium]|nr:MULTISPECIES: maleylpyruvate isomerase family mycothiol-dependent enzyme [Brevibacterium]
MSDSLNACTPSERHRIVAVGFADEIAATTDWSAQTPVPEWTARDVVAHLIDWFPPFLQAGGIALPSVSTDGDLGAAWDQRTTAVQSLLDDGDSDRDFTHPQLGTLPLSAAVDRFYTADIFMHTWDLAQAGGRIPDLDPEYAANLLDGLRSMEEMIRQSGQFGTARPVPGDAGPVVSLMAFIGRDPEFAS